MLVIDRVNVGRPALLGQRRGRDVYSSIAKSPVGNRSVTVGPEGIEGDEQADKRFVRGKRVHGGALKAVYAFPGEHHAEWAHQLGIVVGPATFGENLTVYGMTESEVLVGDEFRCGGVVLRVISPRRPCYKLPMHLGVEDAPQLMNANGFCGWYFAVVTPGELSTSGTLELTCRLPDAISIAEVFAAKVCADPTIPDMPD